jgi:hypothetical protein
LRPLWTIFRIFTGQSVACSLTLVKLDFKCAPKRKRLRGGVF